MLIASIVEYLGCFCATLMSINIEEDEDIFFLKKMTGKMWIWNDLKGFTT